MLLNQFKKVIHLQQLLHPLPLSQKRLYHFLLQLQYLLLVLFLVIEDDNFFFFSTLSKPCITLLLVSIFHFSELDAPDNQGREFILTYLLPTYSEELNVVWLKFEIVQKFLRALLASDVGDEIGPHIIPALPWAHPVVLALIWAQEITFCTRMPASEIEHGTIDTLLGLPVSRGEVYVSETLSWLGSGLCLLTAAIAGNASGTLLADPESLPPGGQIAAVLTNCFALYVAVGGLTLWISTLSSRKGQAVGWVFALVVGSFLLNFLARFWEPARTLEFLSLLTYYRPISVFQGSGWPLADVLTLSLVGGVYWAWGWWIFRRRDIYTL